MSRSAIAAFERPSAISAKDLAFPRRQLVQRRVAAWAPEQPRHHLGIDDRAARGDPAHRVGEVVELHHPLLEQVADAGRIVPDQVDRVASLDVLREDEDRDGRMVRPDPAGRLEALGRVGRRHPDVDDREVRALAIDEGQQAGHVIGLADDLEAGGGESRREGLAEEDGIVGEDDPDPLLGRAQGVRVGLVGDGGGGRYWKRIESTICFPVGIQSSPLQSSNTIVCPSTSRIAIGSQPSP